MTTAARVTASPARSRATATCARVPDLVDAPADLPWLEQHGARAVRPRRRRRPASRSRCRRAGSCAARSSAAADARLPGDDRQRARVLPVPGHATTRPTPRATATSRRTRRGSRTTTSSRRPRTSTSSARSAAAWTAAGVPVEFSKGEAGRGQHEINLDYAEARRDGRPQHRSTRTAAKEIADSHGRSITFMAKYALRRRRLVLPHPLQPVGRRTARPALIRPATAPHHMSELFRWYLGGLIATAREFSLLFAPTVNSYKRFQPGSWAPTGVGWGVDNRTLGFRIVGHGQAASGSSAASPAPTPTPTSRSPARSPAACTASPTASSRRRRSSATATRPTDLARIPSTFVDAIDLWRASDVAARVLRRRRPPPPAARSPRPSGWRSTARSPTGSCAATSSASDPPQRPEGPKISKHPSGRSRGGRGGGDGEAVPGFGGEVAAQDLGVLLVGDGHRPRRCQLGGGLVATAEARQRH